MSKLPIAEEIRLFVVANDENMKIPSKVLRWLSEYTATLEQQAEWPIARQRIRWIVQRKD